MRDNWKEDGDERRLYEYNRHLEAENARLQKELNEWKEAHGNLALLLKGSNDTVEALHQAGEKLDLELMMITEDTQTNPIIVRRVREVRRNWRETCDE